MLGDFFKIDFFFKKSFINTIRVSKSLEQDQTEHVVGPDLGPNCFHRLSALILACKELNHSYIVPSIIS